MSLVINKKTDADNDTSKEKFKELVKIHQYEFILQIIKSIKPESLKSINGEKLKKLQRHLRIHAFMKSNGIENLMGIKPLEKVPFTYFEIKSLVEYLSNHINEKCEKIFEYIENVNEKHPGIFNNDYRISTQNEICELEEKQKEIILKLIHLKIEKYELLKTALNDYKLCSYVENDLDLIRKKFEINSVKIDILKNLVVKKFYSQTEYTTVALKKVENHMDKLLEGK